MRCHLSTNAIESNSIPPDLANWSNPVPPSTDNFKIINDSNGALLESTQALSSSSLQTSSSPLPSPNKRKILDCERGDVEERYRKMQRKKELSRATARASLVVEDDYDEEDEEDRIYEQMDWIEKKNYLINTESDDEESEDDLTCVVMNENSPLSLIPRVKWKEERRHLLKISMAKIRGVDDPETYLRRSVLINNTVKRLQKDVAINYRCHSVASSSFVNLHNSVIGCTAFQNESINSWQIESSEKDMLCKQEVCSEASINFACSSEMDTDSILPVNASETHFGTSYNSLNFHLSIASSLSSAKPFDIIQQDVLHTASFLNKSSTDDKKTETLSSTRTLKQSSSSIHVFPTQPCGLQFRNLVNTEETSTEYMESPNSSSILDSVVYHSLIASLES